MRQARGYVSRGVPAKVAAAAAAAWLELARVDEDSETDYWALAHAAARVYQPCWPLEGWQLVRVAQRLQRVRRHGVQQRAQALARAAAHHDTALLRAAVLHWRRAQLAERCAACRSWAPACRVGALLRAAGMPVVPAVRARRIASLAGRLSAWEVRHGSSTGTVHGAAALHTQGADGALLQPLCPGVDSAVSTCGELTHAMSTQPARTAQ